MLGSQEVVDAVLAAGDRAGEQHWQMPIPEEMAERIKASKIADLLQHDWVRWGGGLMAAAFLREFTAGLPWAHLDIAGKEINTGGPYGHVPSGGTGFGVTTIVEYAPLAARGVSLAACGWPTLVHAGPALPPLAASLSPPRRGGRCSQAPPAFLRRL